MSKNPGHKALSPLLTADDVAELLNISLRTIRRYCSQQMMIPEPVRVGPRNVRWRPQDIEDWIEQGCPPCRW
ncbi:MAG: helix-turn-helix domain-containing protein [Planctomycetes bacterium]|nr:helix-turn-helix domain-containing protein [Planctomycetota bacterium]